MLIWMICPNNTPGLVQAAVAECWLYKGEKTPVGDVIASQNSGIPKISFPGPPEVGKKHCT